MPFFGGLASAGGAARRPLPPLGAHFGHGDSGCTELVVSEMEIATQAREVIENIADRAHFSPVHDTNIHPFEVSGDGPIGTVRRWYDSFFDERP